MSNSALDQLARIPTLTPSSPKRRLLAHRLDLDANSSTIRLVEQDNPIIYSRSPFPSHPSQVLLPKISKLHPRRYAPFEDKDVVVSDENTPTNHLKIHPIRAYGPALRPQRLRDFKRTSSASFSDIDSSIITSSTFETFDSYSETQAASRQSSRTTPPSSPVEELSRLEPVDEESNLGAFVPSPTRPTIRAVTPSASDDHLPLHAEASGDSLSASSFSASLPAHTDDAEDVCGSSSLCNFQVFEHSSSDISLPCIPVHQPELSPAPSIHSKLIHHHASLESLVLTPSPQAFNSDRPRSASPPSRSASQPFESSVTQTVHTAVKIQYPALRQPLASSACAETSSAVLEDSIHRMREDSFRPQQWSSRLSTIASESEQSGSYFSSTDSARRAKRRRTIGSIPSVDHFSSFSDARSSEWEYGSGVLTGTESNISIPIPQPLFSPRPLPDVPDENDVQSRDSDETHDVLGELQAPYLRPQWSGVLSRISSKSSLRPGSADSTKSYGSQISFIGELMWARRYYSRGEPANMIARNHSFVSESSGTARLNTATSGVTSSPISATVPSNVWRPRNRPLNGVEPVSRRLRQETRRIHRSKPSDLETEDVDTRNVSDSSRLRRWSTSNLSIRDMLHSPHLRRDRRQTQRYSLWAAPSFDELLGKSMFTSTNRQILCFAIGFILPVAWWVAALLPLPTRPKPEHRNPGETAESILPVSANLSEFSFRDKRWQKAQWWRRVNRVLAVFGLVLVGTIIALAVIGTRAGGFNYGQSTRTPITVSTSQST